MTENSTVLHYHRLVDAHGGGTGKKHGFRCWLRAHAGPIAGGAMALALIGGVAAIVPEPGNVSDSAAVSLYKKGRISKDRLNLEEKISAWNFDLLQGGPCGKNHQKVLFEIRAEQGRAMDAGDKSAMRKLMDLERVVSAGYRYLSGDSDCAKGASR